MNDAPALAAADVGMEGMGIVGAIAVTDNLRKDAKLTIERSLAYHTLFS